ncbi:ATP12 family chaperone protein [Erythrobacter rubeus]|uniref:Molecular chaperone n=1 Tax=Erythrobacter rubeus TaxID=2760803 RepID=A0ABR8KT37_9SPHN|nr:ATP12 family protein [Erythrobacter rubeus]MBD2842587.1 molecular chaperone [Erythrobacter rubeus]
MKRFFDTVDIRAVEGDEAGWQVTLDGRGLKTVKGSPQIVGTQALAQMLASEWDIQGEELDPKLFPLRDMADYAIDVIGRDKASLADKLMAYGDTDTLLYRADPDEPLYARQQEVWEPIVEAFEQSEGIEMVRISGIIHRPQDENTLQTLKERLGEKGVFELAGLEMMTSLAASLVIALSAADRIQEKDAADLWRSASLEEEWQADLWGRDTEAEEHRAKRQSDFLTAWKFVQAAKG